jgi:16S rRNA (guanine527-N7)-methyltransferase
VSPAAPPPVPDAVLAWYGEAQQLGLLGPGPITDHIAHADRFRAALAARDLPESFAAVDLGTGAGVPGLALAGWFPSARWWLVDGKVTRTERLQAVVEALGWADRVVVRWARAEELGREAAHRDAADVVVARGFGAPAVVAECATALLRRGGWLAVSEPPRRPPRWPAAPLAGLGLAVGPREHGIQLLEKVGETPDGYPRRVGIPAKRPLFGEEVSRET